MRKIIAWILTVLLIAGILFVDWVPKECIGLICPPQGVITMMTILTGTFIFICKTLLGVKK